MVLDIPEAASDTSEADLGTAVIEVKSSDKTYASVSYTIRIKRVFSDVKNVSFKGYSLPVDTFTDESAATSSSQSAYAVYLSSLSDSDKVTMTANSKSANAVKYKVEVLDLNTGNKTWTVVDGGSYTTSAVNLGSKKELLERTSSKGYNVYRITTQYYVYGPDSSTGKLKSDVSYVKVKFVS